MDRFSTTIILFERTGATREELAVTWDRNWCQFWFFLRLRLRSSWGHLFWSGAVQSFVLIIFSSSPTTRQWSRHIWSAVSGRVQRDGRLIQSFFSFHFKTVLGLVAFTAIQLSFQTLYAWNSYMTKPSLYCCYFDHPQTCSNPTGLQFSSTLYLWSWQIRPLELINEEAGVNRVRVIRSPQHLELRAEHLWLDHLKQMLTQPQGPQKLLLCCF